MKNLIVVSFLLLGSTKHGSPMPYMRQLLVAQETGQVSGLLVNYGEGPRVMANRCSNTFPPRTDQTVSDQVIWADRRPIGSLFLARPNTKWPTNPRGWFDSSINITTDQGRSS